jgi:hypothetical protein
MNQQGPFELGDNRAFLVRSNGLESGAGAPQSKTLRDEPRAFELRQVLPGPPKSRTKRDEGGECGGPPPL